MQVAQRRAVLQSHDQRRCVMRVTEHGLAGVLGALGEPCVLLCPFRHTVAVNLQHFGFDVPGNQFARRPRRNDAAVIHDRQALAKALRFVHEMGGQEDGLALGDELPEPVPDQVPRLGIEAGGGLIQEQKVRIVDQRAGERQAPLHSAGQGLDFRFAAIPQPGEIEQVRDAGAQGLVGFAEVAPIDQEVLEHREIRIQVVHLRHYADPDACLACRARNRQAEQVHRAGIGIGEAEAKPQRGGLAGAVRPEQAVALAGFELQADATHHFLARVGLAQFTDFEQGHVRRQARQCRSTSCCKVTRPP